MGSFISRHPGIELTNRREKKVSVTSVTEDAVREWFKSCQENLMAESIDITAVPPEQCFSCARCAFILPQDYSGDHNNHDIRGCSVSDKMCQISPK